jgi:peptide methionine sulfoxide reductase msrA/msrB
VESDYEKLPEVKDVVSGYMGGTIDNPSYNQVSSGNTGHREAVKVVYDPSKTTYRDLVLHLLKHTDPTDAGGSFYDRGEQYASAVYYQNDEEKLIAENVIKEVNESNVFDKPIVTSIEPAGTFWLAEKYHQDYYKKNSLRYNYYRKGSGRDAFIESVWEDSIWKNFQKPSDEELKETLTPLQYKVTQKEGTERAFNNEYFDNHEDGIYVDVVSGEPLFSSTDKFDSGTGWPSFLKPIDKDFVTEHSDYKLIIKRTEIRSKYADSHLGHIILDGPESNNKIRYCMNSAAMRFVPRESMETEGYADFLYLFE